MLKKRKGNQRRLIHALPVNLELDLFEARIATLYDVVDVFLIGGKYVLNIIYHPITNDLIIRSGRLLQLCRNRGAKRATGSPDICQIS